MNDGCHWQGRSSQYLSRPKHAFEDIRSPNPTNISRSTTSTFFLYLFIGKGAALNISPDLNMPSKTFNRPTRPTFLDALPVLFFLYLFISFTLKHPNVFPPGECLYITAVRSIQTVKLLAQARVFCTCPCESLSK